MIDAFFLNQMCYCGVSGLFRKNKRCFASNSCCYVSSVFYQICRNLIPVQFNGSVYSSASVLLFFVYPISVLHNFLHTIQTIFFYCVKNIGV